MAKYRSKSRLIFGMIFLAAGFLVLILMQDSTNMYIETAEEILDECTVMKDVGTVDPSFDGKTVWASGIVSTPCALTDNEFGVEMKAIQLHRECWYYQVEEKEFFYKDDEGEDRVQYSYNKSWVSEPVDSRAFNKSKYRGVNKVRCEVESKDLYATEARLGAYALTPAMIRSADVERLEADVDIAPSVVADFARRLRCSQSLVHPVAKGLFIGKDPSKPQPGDVKVVFTYYGEAPVTVVGVVEGDHFAEGGIQLMRSGNVDLDTMVKTNNRENYVQTIETSFVFLLVMFLGLYWIMGFCSRNAEVSVPVLDKYYIRTKPPYVSALLLTGCLGLIGIGFGRIGNNVILGLLLLGAGVYLLFLYRKKNAAKTG